MDVTSQGSPVPAGLSAPGASPPASLSRRSVVAPVSPLPHPVPHKQRLSALTLKRSLGPHLGWGPTQTHALDAPLCSLVFPKATCSRTLSATLECRLCWPPGPSLLPGSQGHVTAQAHRSPLPLHQPFSQPFAAGSEIAPLGCFFPCLRPPSLLEARDHSKSQGPALSRCSVIC